ncbi:MAG TPA: family 78 glycoside hydrolase catalytic domain [Steroidobacteraceae bacterium]
MNLAVSLCTPVLCLLAMPFGVAAPLELPNVDGLKTEYQVNPLGIDSPAPRFSWRLTSRARGAGQSAYEIRVAADEETLRDGRSATWDSGRVESHESVLRVYGGPKLQSRTRYVWQVRVWNEQGEDGGWSDVAHWEMGLLKPAEWSADWVTPGQGAQASPLLRREFSVHGQIARARVYITSHGLYELYLNGQRVGDQLLTPGWTSYNRRLQYQTYEVTSLLRDGINALGAVLADGWYRGVIGFVGARDHYGDRLALLCQLEVIYQDGHHETITSDQHWKTAGGPILSSGIYAGEDYDARAERPGWNKAGYDDDDWAPVEVMSAPKETLIAPEAPPVRRINELLPVKQFHTPGGDTVLDLGQNMVGWVRLKVKGPAGTVVTLRHAEVLDKDGNFYTDNLRSAKATVRYTLSGHGIEIFEPHFTYQGFRYVAVGGFPGKLRRDSITGIVVHSDMPVTGALVTSSPLVNQLQHNIQWGQKGNFVEVPTDCPQRDERLGWTGDAQVFAATAAFNMDVEGFFSKWLKDLAADQLETGSVPFVVPDVLSTEDRPIGGAAGWGDAATVIPWEMYLAYGDQRVLEQQYPSMRRWVEYEQSRAGADEVWDGDKHFGDWLDYFSAATDSSFGATSTDLIATAYFARSTEILRATARLLGKDRDAARYGEQYDKIKTAFQRAFIAPDGTVGAGTQTAYVLALDFDLVPEELKTIAALKLAEDVRMRGHLTTGFLGTPKLLAVLTRFGYLKEAYRLLNREEYPSWLYPVKHGATTIWERWDGVRPDGTFQNKTMNSFNHYAYGAVGNWMYQTLGGINLDGGAPGYAHVLIQVRPGGGFTHARAEHDSPYGAIRTDWTLRHGVMSLEVLIPANSSATVLLQRTAPLSVRESGAPLATGSGVISVIQVGGDVVVEVAAGRYRFAYPAP